MHEGNGVITLHDNIEHNQLHWHIVCELTWNVTHILIMQYGWKRFGLVPSTSIKAEKVCADDISKYTYFWKSFHFIDFSLCVQLEISQHWFR